MTSKINRKMIEELVEKSNFYADSDLVNFMETSFSEVEKMVLVFLQSDFSTFVEGQNFFLNKVFFTLNEITEINKAREKGENDFFKHEERKSIEKNCLFRDNKVVYKKP